LKLRTKVKPSEVITETAKTIEPYFTLDLPNTKCLYKQKRKQLQNVNPVYINLVLWKKTGYTLQTNNNIVTITLQKQIMMGALKTAQFILIFVGNGSLALWIRSPALHKDQVCVD